jgi:uncharacterized RDD family membrane protein YckC
MTAPMNRRLSDAYSQGHGLFSPEGVRLDLAVSGPAPRMIAYGIDFIIIVALIAILLMTLPIGGVLHKWIASLFHRAAGAVQKGNPANPMPLEVGGVILAVFLLGQFAIETGYFIFWEMLTRGRSPGKALVGLRVVQRNGLAIDLGHSMVRNVFRIVDLLPGYYVVGLISMLLSPSGERLGDHAAGTLVIRLDRPPAAPELATSVNPDSLSLTREQLARIGPREVRLIRGTLRRLETIPEDRREPLLTEVTETLRQHIELAELPSSDRREFLRDLLALTERYSCGRSG